MMRKDASRPFRSLLAALLVAAAAGCSTSNTQGNVVDAQGNHPAGFATGHAAAARPGGDACRPCHGEDLRGGISRISCFSPSLGAQACHASGPAFHPGSWLDCTSVRISRAVWHGSAFVDNVLVNGSACAQCHTPPPLDRLPDGKCVQCHFTVGGARVPAGSPWPHGQITGHAAFQDNGTVKSVCMACHETHNRFGQQPVCHNCHLPFQDPTFGGHPASWLDKAGGVTSFHGTAYQNNTPPCADCHDVGVDSPRCTKTCHFNLGGGRVPAGSVWPHSQIAGHSDNAFFGDNAVRTVCINCHDVNNRFGHMPQPFCHNCHAPFPLPLGTHAGGWLDSDNTAAFHGAFTDQITCETSGCHPVAGHPTCTTCHFTNGGVRNTGTFDHAAADLRSTHQNIGFSDGEKIICENCHQTSRTFRAGIPSCAAGGGDHPGGEGCHYDAPLLDPVLGNPRYQ